MVWMTLNIGMGGNNPYTTKELISLLDQMFPTDALINYRKQLGEWEGKTEETLVVRLNSYDNLSKIISKLETVAKLLNQSCIAVQAEGFELLVYQPQIPERKKVKFDEKYFHDFYTKETLEAIDTIAASGV